VQLVDPASRTTALPVGGGVVRGEDGLLRSNGRSQRTSCSASSRQRAVRHPRERAARHRASLTSAARGLPVSSSCGTHIVDRAEGPGPEADPLPGSWLSPTAVGAACAGHLGHLSVARAQGAAALLANRTAWRHRSERSTERRAHRAMERAAQHAKPCRRQHRCQRWCFYTKSPRRQHRC
jgi:hypothetical protein